LDKLIPIEILYNEGHNYTSVGNTWNRYFNFFTNILINEVKDKTILEIGCPSGKIATQLNKYKKWYIIDPNKNEKVNFPPNIFFLEKFFDETTKINDNINVIIHSHLFEHIYEPHKFLQNCNSLLKIDDKMIFSIPNMDYIANNSLCPFNGVFFEHNIFYNEVNVSYLLELNGFSNINISYFENHSIIFSCSKKNDINITSLTHLIEPPKPILNKSYIDLFINSYKIHKQFYKKYKKIILNKNKEIPTFIFGASYNSQLLWYLLQNKKIPFYGILDNCKEKQNKNFYGTNLTIYEPNKIVEYDEVIVFLQNGYYNNEIKEQLLQIKDVIIIDVA
jgi:SAM-dependent methyltransferase